MRAVIERLRMDKDTSFQDLPKHRSPYPIQKKLSNKQPKRICVIDANSPQHPKTSCPDPDRRKFPRV